MPGWDWSPVSNGMPGFHLTLNPQKVAPEARIYRQFLDHGLVLTDRERDSIMAGREEAIGTLNGMLTLPGVGPDLRLKMATSIADALLDKSLGASLAREAPTVLDRLNSRDEIIKDAILHAPAPGLLERTPVGVSLTVHF